MSQIKTSFPIILVLCVFIISSCESTSKNTTQVPTMLKIVTNLNFETKNSLLSDKKKRLLKDFITQIKAHKDIEKVTIITNTKQKTSQTQAQQVVDFLQKSGIDNVVIKNNAKNKEGQLKLEAYGWQETSIIKSNGLKIDKITTIQ